MRRSIPLALLLVALLPTAAFAQGMLLPKEPGIGPLGIGHQRVRIAIKDGTAVTQVDQSFVNHTGRQLEATYLFPLPKGAAIQDFALWINGKKTKGEVLESKKARAIYEGIVRRMRDPGLLEYVDHQLFRARVFPVPARGEQRVQITFSQVLDFNNGVYTYRFPLGASKVQGARTLQTLKDLTITAHIESKTPIKSVYSPTHRMDLSREGENVANVGFEDLRAALDKDLVLFYTVGKGDVGMNLLAFREDPDEPGYFLLMAAPKQTWQDSEIVGKVVTFVVDTSGSMSGEKMRSAKQALRYILSRLGSDDRFNIVRFSTDVETFADAPVPASEKWRKKALRFVSRMHARGGTAIHDALLTALRQDGRHAEGSPHMIIFLTDGEPTVGETDEGRIAKSLESANTGGSRIFSFGVGTDLNARLLERISTASGGGVDFAQDGRETEVVLSGFYNKVAYPVLADVRVDFEGPRAFDVYPREAPALFRGSQLIVAGRYREAGRHAVVLSGKTGETKRSFQATLEFPETATENAFIPRLWAVRKVGYLLEEIRLHGETPELKDEVVHLGKKFGIVTPYTSYLVVEDEAAPPPEMRMAERAASLPPGFGGRAHGAARAGLAPRRARRAPSAGAPPAAAPAPAEEATVALDAA
ncbi:MAG: VWA domain-containing protein, partial [Deltaproteobacteria bacterium]